jgi:hypothetical protein
MPRSSVSAPALFVVREREYIKRRRLIRHAPSVGEHSPLALYARSLAGLRKKARARTRQTFYYLLPGRER